MPVTSAGSLHADSQGAEARIGTRLTLRNQRIVEAGARLGLGSLCTTATRPVRATAGVRIDRTFGRQGGLPGDIPVTCKVQRPLPLGKSCLSAKAKEIGGDKVHKAE